MNRPKPEHVFFYALASVLVVSPLIFLGLLFLPPTITVLDNWKISVVGTTHTVGDIITVNSVYNKTREVTGTAQRYLECRNGQGVFSRYPISESSANHAPGRSTGTGILLKVPTEIPIPDGHTDCRVSITVHYQINFVRSINQFATSQIFKLLPATTPQTQSTTTSSSTTTTLLETTPAIDQQTEGLNGFTTDTNSAPEDAPAASTLPSPTNNVLQSIGNRVKSIVETPINLIEGIL